MTRSPSSRSTPGRARLLRYDLFESAATPGTYVTVEEWTDQSALDGHLGSAHVAAALAAVDGALTGPPEIHPLTPA